MSKSRGARIGYLGALTIAVVSLGGSLAGCGSAGRVGAARAANVANVALSDYRINPLTITVTSGTLTLIVHNYGLLTHNLVVSQGARRAGSTPPLAPGQVAQIVLTLAPGTYQMSSTILSDQTLGQAGTLNVLR
ncbi:MAG: cupredoxin domain-containing protein [Solirubrobacteraceae bacterium]